MFSGYHSKDMDAAQEHLSRRLAQSVIVTGHQVRKPLSIYGLNQIIKSTEARSI